MIQNIMDPIKSPSTDFNSVCMMLATISVTWIMKKFNLDTMYYGLIYGLMTQLFMWFLLQKYDWIDLSFLSYLTYSPFIIIPFIGFYYYWNYRKKSVSSNHLVINFQTQHHMELFLAYVKYNKQYYETSINMNVGDREKQLEIQIARSKKMDLTDDMYTQAKFVSHNVDEKIKFDDKYLNIEGFYVWKKISKPNCDEKGNLIHEISFKYIEMNILKKGSVDPNEIVNQITTFINEKNKNNVMLRYVKIINGHNHIVKFYDGQKEPIEKLETKYIKTLFHQQKDMLWAIIKNNCLNPEFYSERGQIGRVSLLLHGPPGTGKSTFAFRIAMCLNRHIVSVDLREMDKPHMYQILQRPKEDLCESYKNVVYLFEEFDIAIKDLNFREIKYKKMETEYYDELDNEIQNDDKNKKEKSCNFRGSLFTIRDLLEIFQGPVPFEGMIMLASTNKYDEIKEICPELFRPGRMTPIHFGYIDSDTLQDISKYYFNKKIDGYIPEFINLPTSQIIELVFEALQCGDNPFEYFTEKLDKLVT